MINITYVFLILKYYYYNCIDSLMFHTIYRGFNLCLPIVVERHLMKTVSIFQVHI